MASATGPFVSSHARYIAVRLVPGQDLKQALLDAVKAEGLEAAAVVSLSVSDAQGRTFGGHLVDGSSVYTTAEIVLVELDDLRFRRIVDPVTTYKELAIEPAR